MKVTNKTLNKDTVKVGQRVRLIADKASHGGGNNSSLIKGDTGIVTELENSDTYPNHKWVYINDNKRAVLTEILELLEEPKVEQKSGLKPEDMISGEWYKLTTNGITKCWLIKFHSLEKDSIKSTLCQAIDGSQYNGLSTWGNVKSILEIKKADKSEVEKYYPNEFKSEVLVFDKFKIGSIVVSLVDGIPWRKEGDVFKVLPKSTESFLYYHRDTHNSNKNNWRQATSEECKAFEQGITNIKDMKTENLVGRYLKALKDTPQCITAKAGDYFKIEGEIETSFNIVRLTDSINFGASKELLGTTWELMPEGFTPETNQFIVGKWYKADGDCYIKYTYTEKEQNYNKVYGETITSGNYRAKDYWAASVLEKEALRNGPLTDLSEIQQYLPNGHVDKVNTEDPLITEAKKRFPVGTLFYPAHLDQKSQHCIVTNTNFKLSGDCIYALTDDGQIYDPYIEAKYGNTQYNRCVYQNGSWAEIVTSNSELEVGDWVTITKKPSVWSGVAGGKYPLKEVQFPFTGKMEKLQKEKGYTSANISGYGFSLEDCDIRKATAEEIAKAQGYKVVLTDTFGVDPSYPVKPDGSDIEAILAYCKSVYKEGMKIIPVTSTGHSYDNSVYFQGELKVYSDCCIGNTNTSGYVYANGKYAEIVNKPVEEFKGYWEAVSELSTNCIDITPDSLPIVKRQKTPKILDLELVKEKQTINLPIIKKQTIKN